MTYKAPNSTEEVNSSVTPTALAPTLQAELPEIEQATRLFEYSKAGNVESKDETTKEKKKLMYADPNFFNTLSYTFIEGDAKHALTEPNQIVLTKKLAEKYFPKQSALGKP
ncbi:ABC transporter permease [Sphingobacterium sp. E70]|uniref:ABC transporter permease n=1 Tax=Sphingobacterium sp. E70 TaxID=2853439 RepID=UPI00211BA736|nr:ABC transporter permease [Sphingobacterium sp. E70]ULT27392.1 ABC transporter permease [Sphingobacterium sp. E70]